jgi:hypothetical protein
MNAQHRIKQWFHRVEEHEGRMEREDVCFLMVQARLLIESSVAPQRYRIVEFYADWTVHTVLDRSPACSMTLRDITRLLAENWGPTTVDITSEVSKIIGFPQLRAGLIALFQENDLPVVLFEFSENWKGFVGSLLWLLEGKPIRFPEKPTRAAKVIREETIAIERPRDMVVEGLEIVNYEAKPHWLLHLSGEKAVTIMGVVSLGESAEAFSPSPAV